MKKKIVVIGGVAGGASAAARLRRLNEEYEITIFEKGPNVSFSNCSLPYYLSGIVPTKEDLIMMNPQLFLERFNIKVKVKNEVIKIDKNKKEIIVKDIENGRDYTESYDYLILSPGAKAILPKSIQGVDSGNVFTVRNVEDIANLKSYIENNKVKNISVIGGGFIGIEVAENLKEAGYNVTLVEAQDQIMTPFDYDMVQILHKEMKDKGIELILEDSLVEITDDSIKLSSGKIVESECVVMSIGVIPEVKLAESSGLSLGQTGAILVNQNFQTNDENIYAVGDAIEVYNTITKEKTKLPLAGPAQRQARGVADHIINKECGNLGVVGSSIVKVFEMNAASTGINEKQAKRSNINYDYIYIMSPDKVGIMPECNVVHFKLLYELPTGKIIGAQAIGKGNVDKRIDVIAAMIKMNASLEDLKELELCYSPVFGTAKDVVNMAAMVALNQLKGEYKQVGVSEVRDLVEAEEVIIDVREKSEYENGHLINAINIPLGELRSRLSEIPTDRPVYLHCRTSQRSYYATKILKNLGYDNIINISGSFLGISYYEYFQDINKSRKPILTDYNFN